MLELVDLATSILTFATIGAAFLFVLLYSIFFDPNATTAGKMIRRMMLSLVALGMLPVVGSFVPERPEWWGVIRLGIWGFVAFSFFSMVWLLIVRRFWPKRLRTRPKPVVLDGDTIEPRPRRNRR